MNRIIYYRPDGDRKFYSENINEVIDYMQKKHNLSLLQVNELKEYGITQSGKEYGITQFRFKNTFTQ